MLFEPRLSVEEYTIESETEMQNTIPSLMDRELRSPGQRRHWSSSSQTYATADVLLDYLADGWTIRSLVGQEVSWRGGGRHITVHHFELTRDHQVVTVPVLDNPIVRRLVAQRRAQVGLLEWMLSDGLKMRSRRRDLRLEAGMRPAFLRPRLVHSATTKLKLMTSSEV